MFFESRDIVVSLLSQLSCWLHDESHDTPLFPPSRTRDRTSGLEWDQPRGLGKGRVALLVRDYDQGQGQRSKSTHLWLMFKRCVSKIKLYLSILKETVVERVDLNQFQVLP